METSIPTSNEPAESPVNARPKRSRTGCLTCRNRRRKCDERKPICQNCMSKGLECRYAAAFQILGKHNFTPEVKTDVKYAIVRFAGDNSDDGKAPASKKTCQPVTTTDDQHCRLSTQTDSTTTHSQAATDPFDTTKHTVSSHSPSPNSYEFAVHGLLALGSTFEEPGANALPALPASGVGEEQSVSTYDFASDDNLSPALDGSIMQKRPGIHRKGTEQISVRSFGTIGHSTPGTSSRFENFEGLGRLTQAYEASNSNASIPAETLTMSTAIAAPSLELLTFFRYNVAPWLDICDSEQQFGVSLLIKSAQVPCLRTAIMHLAAASSSMAWASGEMRVGRSTSDRSRSIDIASDIAVETVVDVFNVLADATPNLAAFWLRDDRGKTRTRLLERLLLGLGLSDLSTCAYWLLVRIELSCALMERNNRIPLPFLTGQYNQVRTNDPRAQCAYDTIALCVDAAMFTQGDDDQWLQQRHGTNRVEVWKALVQGFANWYMHRPQAFQPIVELYPKDGMLADDDYPTILFTSGAALLANQLYHTGMLLLLQNKPRFAENRSQNSPSMSTLWHAHRICGIAIQNDRPGWWDPCLIASLVVAGRTATHASQHNVIVSALQSVQQLTGWIIDPYMDQLRSEWQLADSWG
ncbi:uncharacterized protein EKO05_0002639 [Ascochyta rabiei]|uniref:uncharacterized protein n=1 Tax=Didymella rabiei TaxID=5454 RepID=UPI002205FE38|nr:uncharacterized protein EKO05_0002639 [Ascochyta rabiei]UPX12063.1 hypothetical protein EKO05_0002639 [Ascochyta rabiei]